MDNSEHRSAVRCSRCGGLGAARCRWSLPRRIAARDYPGRFPRRFAPRPADLAALRGQLCRRDLRCRLPSSARRCVAARFPRAYLDVNREAWELDPAMFSDALPNFVNIRSPRVRMGLGTIARVVASGEEIYARKLRFAEARARVEALYHPYHHALRRLVARDRGGVRRLSPDRLPLDAVGGQRGRRPGRRPISCSGTAMARPARRRSSRRRDLSRPGASFAVAMNAPYAGGFTTGALRQPAARPACAADRDQPRPLHGRAQLPPKAGLLAAGSRDDGARRASRPEMHGPAPRRSRRARAAE